MPKVEISLHIDDGCLGGGEDDITEGDSEDLAISDAIDIYDDDPNNANDPAHFLSERKPFFSYCLFTEGINNPDDPKNAYTLEAGKAFVLPVDKCSASQVAEGFGNYLAFHNLVDSNTKDASGKNDSDGDGLKNWAEGWFGSDPNDADKDTDEDGIDDLWEAEHSFYPYEANPTHKDIFVEVDWMPYYSGWHWSYQCKWFCPGLGGISPFHYGFYTSDGMSNDAAKDVVKAFSKKDITLHIDRGGMGGGESIDFESSTTFDEWKDMYDDHFFIFPDGSSSNRIGVFHYCTMVNKLTGNWWGKDSSGWGAAGEYNGDQIAIEGGAGDSVDIANIFMHEIGHNIIGVESTNPLAVHLDNSGHCSNNDCPLQSVVTDGKPGYCSNCWNAIDFTKVSWG